MLRNIRLLYVHNFLSDFWPQWPFLVIYLADKCGSYTLAMTVIAAETLSAAFFDIPTGIFSDRMGRRFTMACGSLSTALAISCYAFAPGIELLYAGATLWGLGQCLFSGNNNALLYESLQSEGLQDQYHHYRGSTGSMYQLALGLSAFLAMGLSTFGLQTIFIVAIVPQVLNIFVSLLFEEPRQHTSMRPKGFAILKQACVKTWKNPHLLCLVMAKAISYGSGEAKFKFQSAFVNSLWPIWAVGLQRGLNHVVGFCGFHFAGRIIEHLGEGKIFLMRDIFWFANSMLAILLNSFASPIILLANAFPFGPGEVASDHLMQKEFTDDERATMGSISSFCVSIVFAVVSVSIGVICDRFGIGVGLATGTVFVFLSFPINVWSFRKSLGFKWFSKVPTP